MASIAGPHCDVYLKAFIQHVSTVLSASCSSCAPKIRLIYGKLSCSFSMPTVQQVHAYLSKFRKYDWLWKEDKDVQYKRFVESNPNPAIADYEVIAAANAASGDSIMFTWPYS